MLTTLYYLLHRSASLPHRMLFHRALIRVDVRSAMQQNIPPLNRHLPPHLREVCAILVAGLLRLRSRNAEECARDAAETGDHGKFRLHFLPHQRGHATRTNGRDA